MRSGPATAAGRWSLVAEVLDPDITPTERTAALAHQLLDRYGVVPRGVAAVEELPGGFSAVYPALKVLEESGRARRGYFIEGLGGAQFCLPGAVDRLRAVREPGTSETGALVLAATDPANPYGGVLAWPETPHRHTPKRVRNAYVVLLEGALVGYVGKGGRSLLTFTDEPAGLAAVGEALGAAIDAGRLDPLRLQRLDAEAVTAQPIIEHLRSAGFVDHPQGLVRRPTRS